MNEEILDWHQEAGIFSTTDLWNGFFHAEVEPQSRKNTAFVTHDGQFQFLKVKFGLCNSPAVFHRLNTIFRPLIKNGIILPYLDCIIILPNSVEEGIKKIERILNRAADYRLEINFKKSVFKKCIEFQGHIIEEGKIYPSPLKTQAVLNFLPAYHH